MAKTNHIATRRAVLGAALAIPAVAATGGTIAITAAKAANGAEWYATKAAYDEARRAEYEFDRDIFSPADRLARAEYPPEPELRVGELRVTRAYIFNPGPLRDGTVLSEAVKNARTALASYDAEVARVRAKYGVGELDAECDRLNEEAFNLKRQLFELPAPDGAALLWKMQNLPEGFDDWHEQMLADARRLLSDGRA